MGTTIEKDKVPSLPSSRGGYTQQSVKGTSTSSSSGKFSFLSNWAPQFIHHGSINDNVKSKMQLPTETKGVFEPEKPIVFSYDDVMKATGQFLESRKLGEGAFGAVYFGNLYNQEVAIKKMKASKSREFMAELKVLCKVHHANLVELIGYATTEEELYLVYEFAENGALSDHLHHPKEKGYQPLGWTMRVQIALDAARGLEYIHEHTKTHYIHRDIKSSNILLNGLFRAKVGDFGLAKLIEHAGEGGDSTTRVVGTIGYLAPEYVRDGHVTSKSDVYAFGVVLMELITGNEALTKSKISSENQTCNRRSLVIMLLSMFQNGELNSEMLKSEVDPSLEESYPLHAVCKMAEIAKACTEDDSMVRPDMREVVFKLSQVLLSSTEWEAAMAGNGQIFSGLIQGR